MIELVCILLSMWKLFEPTLGHFDHGSFNLLLKVPVPIPII